MARALYICYFGIREPLVQTQVLAYLRELLKGGHRMSLLTFEPDLAGSWTTAQIEAERKKLKESGIDWHFLAYHKRPSVPATLFDLANGTRFVVGLARREKIDIFHVRGHIPGPIGATAKIICGGKLLFDIRGFMPEEYTDAGIWNADGYIYRSFKRVEKWLMRMADGFVVLTEAARDILFPDLDVQGRDRVGRPVEVIPCCVDTDRFRAEDPSVRERMRAELGASGRKVIAYVGSFGGWYLTDEMLSFFALARERDNRYFALVLTQRNKEEIAAEFRKRGFGEDDFFVASVPPAKVPDYLSAADLAISFIRACYSKRSSSPTKIAEYLLAGLPIISNSGVGDLDALIKGEKVGAVLDEFSQVAFAKALEEVEMLREEGAIRQRCVEAARRYFDLETIGGTRYRRLYERMLNGGV